MLGAQCVRATALRLFVCAGRALRDVRADAAETEGAKIEEQRNDAAKPDTLKTPPEAIEAPPARRTFPGHRRKWS